MIKSQRKILKKGSALSFAIVIISVVSIILFSMIQYIVSQIKYSSYTVTHENSLHIAEAGINFYQWYLAHQVNGKTADQVANFWENGSPYGVGSTYESDYEGIGHYSISVIPPSVGSTSILVESTGWMLNKSDITRTIRVRMRLPAWCEYVIFSDSDLSISDGEDVYGQVYSNGGVRFDGVAHNTVYSAMETYFDTGTGQDEDGVWTDWAGEYNTNMGSDVFLGGKQFPAPDEDFDSVLASFSQMFDKAQELNFDFGSDGIGHQVIIRNDKVDIYKVIQEKDGSVKKRTSVQTDVDLPDVAVIYVGKSAWVEGTLGSGKKLSIATTHSGTTHGDIRIANDIVYEDYTSGTVLGLVAKNDVEIAKDSENDLRIDAALLAQNGGVSRSYATPKSTITIYGAIVTKQGYGFQGYTNRIINFDNNLKYNPPPFFPTEMEYKMDLWEEL